MQAKWHMEELIEAANTSEDGLFDVFLVDFELPKSREEVKDGKDFGTRGAIGAVTELDNAGSLHFMEFFLH